MFSHITSEQRICPNRGHRCNTTSDILVRLMHFLPKKLHINRNIEYKRGNFGRRVPKRRYSKVGIQADFSRKQHQNTSLLTLTVLGILFVVFFLFKKKTRLFGTVSQDKRISLMCAIFLTGLL